MKKIVMTLLALAAMQSTASAAQVEFRGRFCITVVSPACTAEGWSVGDCTNARFNPPNVEDNGPSTRFTIIDNFFGENYTLPAGSLISNTLKDVDGAGVGRGAFTFDAKMKFFSQAPQAPVAATPFVNITGAILNFDGIQNCGINFRSALMPR